MTENTSANLDPDEELPDGQTPEHPSGSPRVPRFVEEPETDVVGSEPAPRAYRVAVASVFADHRAEARLSAVKAVHIDAARVAHAAECPEDRSSGGPKWTSEVIAQRELVTELSAGLRISENSARACCSSAVVLSRSFLRRLRR